MIYNTVLTSGSQHLDRYGVYHFDAQINGVHQFGAVFPWYTGLSADSADDRPLLVHSASASPVVRAQLFQVNNKPLELQVELIGDPEIRLYDIIFSRLV